MISQFIPHSVFRSRLDTPPGLAPTSAPSTFLSAQTTLRTSRENVEMELFAGFASPASRPRNMGVIHAAAHFCEKTSEPPTSELPIALPAVIRGVLLPADWAARSMGRPIGVPPFNAFWKSPPSLTRRSGFLRRPIRRLSVCPNRRSIVFSLSPVVHFTLCEQVSAAAPAHPVTHSEVSMFSHSNVRGLSDVMMLLGIESTPLEKKNCACRRPGLTRHGRCLTRKKISMTRLPYWCVPLRRI